jgi:hypothetical protein
MALVPFGPAYVPLYPASVSGAPTYIFHTIDAAGEKVQFVVPGKMFGQSIRKILWRTATVTTGDTVDVRAETVDNTTGNATGTLVNVNANASQVVANGDDDTMFTTTLTADADVSALEYFAVVIANGVGGGNMQIALFGDDSSSFPYTGLFTASWAKSLLPAVVGFELVDGSYLWVDGCYPMSAITSSTYNNTSTPDVYANRITIAAPCTIDGFWLWANFAADCAVKLYDTDGVTVLASRTIDATNAVSAINIQRWSFPTAVDVTAGDYWIGVEPTGAGNIVVYDWTVPTAAAMDAFQGGQNMQFSTAKDPSGTGSWSTTATRRLFLGVRFSAIDDGAGAGGGAPYHGAMSGGML